MIAAMKTDKALQEARGGKQHFHLAVLRESSRLVWWRKHWMGT